MREYSAGCNFNMCFSEGMHFQLVWGVFKPATESRSWFQTSNLIAQLLAALNFTCLGPSSPCCPAGLNYPEADWPNGCSGSVGGVGLKPSSTPAVSQRSNHGRTESDGPVLQEPIVRIQTGSSETVWCGRLLLRCRAERLRANKHTAEDVKIHPFVVHFGENATSRSARAGT